MHHPWSLLLDAVYDILCDLEEALEKGCHIDKMAILLLQVLLMLIRFYLQMIDVLQVNIACWKKSSDVVCK